MNDTDIRREAWYREADLGTSYDRAKTEVLRDEQYDVGAWRRLLSIADRSNRMAEFADFINSNEGPPQNITEALVHIVEQQPNKSEDQLTFLWKVAMWNAMSPGYPNLTRDEVLRSPDHLLPPVRLEIDMPMAPTEIHAVPLKRFVQEAKDSHPKFLRTEIEVPGTPIHPEPFSLGEVALDRFPDGSIVWIGAISSEGEDDVDHIEITPDFSTDVSHLPNGEEMMKKWIGWA